MLRGGRNLSSGMPSIKVHVPEVEGVIVVFMSSMRSKILGRVGEGELLSCVSIWLFFGSRWMNTKMVLQNFTAMIDDLAGLLGVDDHGQLRAVGLPL